MPFTMFKQCRGMLHMQAFLSRGGLPDDLESKLKRALLKARCWDKDGKTTMTTTALLQSSLKKDVAKWEIQQPSKSLPAAVSLMATQGKHVDAEGEHAEGNAENQGEGEDEKHAVDSSGAVGESAPEEAKKAKKSRYPEGNAKDKEVGEHEEDEKHADDGDWAVGSLHPGKRRRRKIEVGKYNS